MAIPLSGAFVEYIHDVVVGLWMPFDEPVDPADYKDINLLESAVGRPFQTFGGNELFPTIPAKAAALFHALVCNHCFTNGNKRTAVIALDFFLTENDWMLAVTNEDMYALATQTAIANRDGRRPDEVVAELTTVLEAQSVSIADIDPASEPALTIGSDRVQKMLSRVKWLRDMLQKLVALQTPPTTMD